MTSSSLIVAVATILIIVASSFAVHGVHAGGGDSTQTTKPEATFPRFPVFTRASKGPQAAKMINVNISSNYTVVKVGSNTSQWVIAAIIANLTGPLYANGSYARLMCTGCCSYDPENGSYFITIGSYRVAAWLFFTVLTVIVLLIVVLVVRRLGCCKKTPSPLAAHQEALTQNSQQQHQGTNKQQHKKRGGAAQQGAEQPHVIFVPFLTAQEQQQIGLEQQMIKM